MKKQVFLISAFFFLSSSLFSQGIEGSFTYSKFMGPDGPFIETCLAINGESIAYTDAGEGKIQGLVEVTLLCKQNDSIKFVDKYDLASPLLAAEDSIKPSFIDQQRIVLPMGVYDLELSLSDKNILAPVTSKVLSYHDVVVFDFPKDSLFFSDIQLVESFAKTSSPSAATKSGLDVVPFASDFYPTSIENLIYYAEIYHADKSIGPEEEFLITYAIESHYSDMAMERYKKFQKQSAAAVNVAFNQFSINELPSGNYNLCIEARTRDNELVAIKKRFFQRSNPTLEIQLGDLEELSLKNTFVEKYTSVDELAIHISSLSPISTAKERLYATNQLAIADVDLMQKYFLRFWSRRDALTPEKAWLDYKAQVAKVDKEYKIPIRKGYETDRGRVYLQYGQPNSVTSSDQEPSSYPYEIWHYYKVGNYSNVKFIFYNPNLVTNDYELLHSTVIGEPYDPAWHYKLHKRDTQLNDINTKTSPWHYGSRSQENWDSPR